MADFYPFVIAGLVSGSVYGLTAAGLVLTYKTSGIFNFAHGALAALGAYLFFQLRDEWGLPWPVAIVLVVLGAGPVVGFALEWLARMLDGSSTAARVVATVGLLTATQGLLTGIYGAAVRSLEPFLPTKVFSAGSINIGYDQVLIFGIAAAATAALSLYLRRSRVGTAMRGVVDDPNLLALAGTDPVRVRRRAWAIGSSFALLSGILLAPSIGLDPLLLTLLAVQAFGAAAVGRFSSLPLTFGGGLLLGVGASLSTKYVADIPVLSGFPASLPFVVLFLALVFSRPGRLVELGTFAARAASTRARAGGVARQRITAVAAIGLLVGIPSFAGARLPVFTTAVIYVLLFASLRLLIVTSGQVSLCHVTFAAVGATSFAHLTTGLGLPWGVALVLAGLVTVPVGAVVAVPAIRLSGLYLALATLGFGILVDRLVYPMGVMFGADGFALAPRPDLGVFDATTDRGFYFVCVAAVLVGMGVLHLVDRSRLGRLLRALSDSPLALTTLGTSVTLTRVIVFCIASFFAGVSGALLVAFSGTTNGVSFASLQSLSLVVVLVIAGRSEVASPLVAAAALYVTPAYITNASFNEYLPVAFGLGAITVSILGNSSNGVAERLRSAAGRSHRRARVTRTSIRDRRRPAPVQEALL